MVKQLSLEEESYLQGLMDGGSTYRNAQTQFKKKFGRNISPDTILRVKKGIGKIGKRINPKPRITTERNERTIQKVIKQNRWLSWEEIKSILATYNQIEISIATLRRRAKELGISGRVAKKRPLISKKCAKKRLAFAKKYRRWTKENWAKVIIHVDLLVTVLGYLLWRNENQSTRKWCRENLC